MSLRPVVHGPAALVTSDSAMTRLNLAERLPNFKKIGDGIGKLRGLLHASGLVSGTVPWVQRSRASSKGQHPWAQSGRRSGLPASLVADVPHDAFGLLSGGPGDDIRVACRFRQFYIETDCGQPSSGTFVISINEIATASAPQVLRRSAWRRTRPLERAVMELTASRTLLDMPMHPKS